jgi:hypothetical protein
MGAASRNAPGEERVPLLEGLIAPVRRYGIRSFVLAITIVGIIASLLSASGIVLELWEYMLITAGTFVAVLGVFLLSSPRYKFWLVSRVYRRPKQSAEGLPYRGHVQGTRRRAPVRQVAAGRKIDRVYEGGFRALLDARNPVAIIASSPRDVSNPNALPAGMWSRGATRTECVVDPSVFGIPVERYSFERHMTEGRQDIDHMLAIKDILYVPELAQALRPQGFDATAEPFMWPEHHVDMPFLASHDLVVIGGGDSNFWHAALFEPVRQSFLNPPSTIPLALDLLDSGDSGVPFYGSRLINVRLAGKERIPGLEKARRYELDERRFPTCAMIVAVENPFARALGRDHWCVFVSGMRSLGGSGAVLALAALLDAMRSDPELNYASLVETAEPDVHARVSALLVRTTMVEYAAEAVDGTVVPRGRRAVPADRPDPEYRDSYSAIGVEYLDNVEGPPEWRPLVTVGTAARAPAEPVREEAAVGA